MRLRHAAATPLLLLALAACGGDGPSAPPDAHASIAGSYAGALSGVSEGVAADLDVALTINQSAGNLSGSYAITGILTDGLYEVDVQGTGTLTGTIAAGNNPSVNITVRPATCPNRTAQFSGSYDSVNQRLTIAGPIEITDETCAVFLTYPSTLILTP